MNFACRVVLNSFSVINQWLEGWNIMGKRLTLNLSQDYSLCTNKDTVLYSSHNKRKPLKGKASFFYCWMNVSDDLRRNWTWICCRQHWHFVIKKHTLITFGGDYRLFLVIHLHWINIQDDLHQQDDSMFWENSVGLDLSRMDLQYRTMVDHRRVSMEIVLGSPSWLIHCQYSLIP